MKSLQIIQKTYHVFEILLRIGMIAAFIWVAISAAGVICAIVWQDSIAVQSYRRTGRRYSLPPGSALCQGRASRRHTLHV